MPVTAIAVLELEALLLDHKLKRKIFAAAQALFIP
jgi:hypothetical protein